MDGHRLLLCMFKGNPGVLPEGATDLQVSFVVVMGGCEATARGWGSKTAFLPRKGPASLPISTSQASSSLLTIYTCVVTGR